MPPKKHRRSSDDSKPHIGTAGTSSPSGECSDIPGLSSHDELPVFQFLDDKSTAGNATGSPRKPNSLLSFLQQSLPFLTKNQLHTPSTKTRQYGFFDMHLHKDLRLKKIVFLDGLIKTLSELCDSYVADFLAEDRADTFPILSFPSDNQAVNETSVASYALQWGTLHSIVASELLFKTNWNPVFEVSRTPKTESTNLAAADAYVYLSDDSEALAHVSNMHKCKSEFRLLEKYDLQNFLVTEYKNLSTEKGIFDVLRSQEGDFHWTACQERSSPDEPSVWCKTKNHRVGGRPSICGRRTGPDSSEIEEFIRKSNICDTRPGKRRRTDENDSMKSCKDHTKPRLVLQQLWTSAVVQDATFVVLSSGNQEYIGIRHRETQTLYLSSPIRPSESGYIKICVALYIESYKDVLNRASRLKAGLLPQHVQSTLRLYSDKEPSLPNLVKSLNLDRCGLDLSQSDVKIDEALQKISQLPLRMHQHRFSATQFDRNTWMLSRYRPEETESSGPGHSGELVVGSVPPSTPTEMISNSIFLDLDQLIQGRVFRICPAIIYSPDDIRYLSYSLVMKMAREADEVAKLKQEHRIYRDLKNKGVHGIVKNYGLFSYSVNALETRYFLLLQECGKSITKRPSFELGAHVNRHLPEYENAMFSFHCEGGVIHNDITSDHIMMDVKRKKAALISLAHCTPFSKSSDNSVTKGDIEALHSSLGRGNGTNRITRGNGTSEEVESTEVGGDSKHASDDNTKGRSLFSFKALE